MNGRWMHWLVAALYLLPQLGLVLHHDDVSESCGSCEERYAGPRLECADEDCGESGHHHHRHHVHHAGTCRVCPAASHLAVEETFIPASRNLIRFERTEAVRSAGSPRTVARDPRGPPAA